MSTDRAALIERVNASADLVDVLTALLAECRRHAAELGKVIQGGASRRMLSATAVEVHDELGSVAAVPSALAYIAERLTSAEDYVLTARALAYGIDLMIRTQDASRYSVMLQSRKVRTLADGDPYPRSAVDLKPMYGAGGFSTKPRDGGSILAVDRVVGLALWSASDYGALRAVYDPIAGQKLDHCLPDPAVNILTVTPNRVYPEEWSIASVTKDGFFDVAVKDTQRQNDILRSAMSYCAENRIEVLLLPELAGTDEFDAIITDAFAAPASPANGSDRAQDGYPRIVVAGSRHLEVAGSPVNRLSTRYRGWSKAVHHHKVGRYVVGDAETRTERGLQPNHHGEERIDRGCEVRIHAGRRWSMIPLICADFLDGFVVKAVASLCPKLVLVSSMSQKTEGFERSGDTVIAECQATVAIANGPAEWKSGAGGAKTARSDVAIFMLPLNDASNGVRRISPPPGVDAPYLVHFRSLSRATHLVE